MTGGLPLMKNVLTPLAKSVLIILGLTAASATDACIQKKIFGSGTTLYVNADNVTYFDNFGVEHTPKEISKFIGNKNITTNIYGIQTYHLIMCEYFCIRFIDFMLKGKSLLEYKNLFSPNEIKKEWQNNIKTFSIESKYKMMKWWKSIVMLPINIENLKTVKYHIFLKKTLGLSIVCNKCVYKYKKKIFKGEESIEILKILGLNI